ncbi:MAG: 23S rRNA (adenine(2503)-C(2))-methyltransferase RlmN [Bacteroidia bacterium]|nr:23S rRNA (adenine(2503)-C(2))-methyltransferase RlmN [Bacteroidia bacterium]MDW8014560.1 23S rRNA (adenine(2503)-C(2))-methyltransferase RlmN [Bacteroidia bacterium]
MVGVKAIGWTFSPREWERWVEEKRESLYRARQIWHWIWKKGVYNPAQMSDVPLSIRTALDSEVFFPMLELVRSQESRDGTRKFLWALPEGGKVETVWIPHQNRYTVCISSQVGCSLNCRFCATGQLGLERQLKGYEILLQVYAVKHLLGLPITNVVFMGMGEPLLNYSAVIEAVEGLTQRMGFSGKRLTISTVGIPKAIQRLAERSEPFELAFSLHSAIPEKRRALIPLAAHISLEELQTALGLYCEKRNEWITLEYVLLEDINDQEADAEALREFIKPPLRAKVNLIEYNPVPELPFRGSRRIKDFQQALLKRRIITTIRRSRGADIAAACGQLSRRF